MTKQDVIVMALVLLAMATTLAVGYWLALRSESSPEDVRRDEP